MVDLRNSNRHFIVGVVILSLGCILLLDQIGILDASRIFMFWPLALIFFGYYRFTHTRLMSGRFWGGFCFLLGLALQAEELGYGHVRFDTIWPVLLICAGVLLILKRYEPRSYWENPPPGAPPTGGPPLDVPPGAPPPPPPPPIGAAPGASWPPGAHQMFRRPVPRPPGPRCRIQAPNPASRQHRRRQVRPGGRVRLLASADLLSRRRILPATRPTSAGRATIGPGASSKTTCATSAEKWTNSASACIASGMIPATTPKPDRRG